MRAEDQVIVRGVPDSLLNFIRETCRVAADDFRRIPPGALPEPARTLLAHLDDMTSTLTAFYGSPLRVEIFQQQQADDLYLREVFLRTSGSDRIVEYGVIGIALEQFTAPSQAAIQSGAMPLGDVLHRFQIPFVSAPLGYFAVPGDSLAGTPLAQFGSLTCHGRFNRLSKPTGESLAWILEILPP